MVVYFTRDGKAISQICVSVDKTLKDAAKERKINFSALLTRAIRAELEDQI